MKNYIVKTKVELAAVSATEAEEIVMGLDLVDLTGQPVDAYVEIEEVIEIE